METVELNQELSAEVGNKFSAPSLREEWDKNI